MFCYVKLGEDFEKQEVLYGKRLLNSFDTMQLLTSNEVVWFRDTLQIVRDAMNLQDGIVGIERLQVYEKLVLTKRGKIVPRKRKRRGMVLIGSSPCLYITPEGISNSRVRFEEVAHSLQRLIPSDSPELRHAAKMNLSMRDLIKKVHTENHRLPKKRKTVLFWILCHKLIFESYKLTGGFQNDSQDEKDFVNTRLDALATRCRLSIESHQCPC